MRSQINKIFVVLLLALLAGIMIACQANATPTPTMQAPQVVEVTSTSQGEPIATDYSVDTPAPVSTATLTDTPQPTFTIQLDPTETSTSTVVPTSDPTRYVTRTRTPTRTWWPTRTPTITLTPRPPSAPVEIGVPGPLSKASSPLHMEAGVLVGDNGMIYLELRSETGAVLHSRSFDYRSMVGKVVYFYENIPFLITDAAETARLIVSTRDQYGRTMALNSVDVILMQLGDDEINPQYITLEPYIVRNPQEKYPVSGGVMIVSGLVDPVNTSPVKFDLIATDGSVLASGSLQIAEPTGNLSHTPFRIDIPYSIPATTQVRLTIYQESDNRIPGIIFLTSLLITLNP